LSQTYVHVSKGRDCYLAGIVKWRIRENSQKDWRQLLAG
jgi:hypothetical protein